MIKNKNVKSLPELDRPYERVELYGAKTLTDSELLAVMIRTGTKNQNAIDVSRELLCRFRGGISEICSAGINELTSVDGIGRVKAIQLKVLGELASRISSGRFQMLMNAKNIDALGQYMSSELSPLRQEIFRIILLDKKLRVVNFRDVSVGILDRTLVHPREVFTYAVRECCSEVILVHNHPSGELLPSSADIKITERLVQAGVIIGINVYDHIIVGGNGFFSMRESGDIECMTRAARKYGYAS